MRVLSRRPAALLVATALLATGGLTAGLVDTAHAAVLTISTVTNPVNSTNRANVHVTGMSTPGDPVRVTATDSYGVTVPALSSPPDATTADSTGAYDEGGKLDVTSLADGAITVVVTSVANGTAQRTVNKDTAAPTQPVDVTVAPSPVNAANQTSVKVTSQVGIDAATVRLSIADSTGKMLSQYPTSSSTTYTATFGMTTLADGTLTVTSGASDAAGNESTRSTTVVKDTVAPATPTVVVTTGAVTPVRVNVASPGSGGKVTVTGGTGSGGEAATYVLTVTDSLGAHTTYTPASSTPSATYSIQVDPYPFADGPLTFSVVATDAAANPSAAGTTQIGKDTSAPVVTNLVMTNPINEAKRTTVVVSGKAVRASGSTSASESGTTVTIHLDGSVIDPGTVVLPKGGPPNQSPTIAADGTFSATFDVSNLNDGPQAITANATPTDPFGNTGPATTTKSDKDTAAPGKPIVTSLGDALPGNLTAVQFSGTAEDGSSVVVTVKDSATGAVNVTVTAAANGTYSGTVNATQLADGAIVATAVATDAAGNQSLVSNGRTASKDVTAFALLSASPTGTTASASKVQATYNEPLSVTGSSIVVKTNPGNAPVAGNTSYSPDGRTILFTPTSTFADGGYRATVIGKESGVGDDPAITTLLTFTVDGTVPAAPVLTAITNPIGTPNQANVHVTGTAEPGSTVVVTITEPPGSGATPPPAAHVSSAPTLVAAGGTFDAVLNVTSLKDGILSAQGIATDAAHNASAASGAKTATKDTVAPTVAGTAASDTTQTAPKSMVTATASEAGDAFVVTLKDKDGLTATGSGTTGAGGAISIAIDASTLADGPVGVVVVVTDPAGNASDNAAAAAKATFTKDATGPTTTGLTGSKVNISAAGKTTISGSVGEPGTVTVTVTNGTKSVSGSPTVGSGGAFTLTDLDVSSLPDGTLTVSAVGKDAKGNSGPAVTTTVTKDTVRPVVTGLAATSTTGASSIATVTGSTEPGSSVHITVTDGTHLAKATATAAGDGSFTASLDLAGFTSGFLPVTATATDVEGNVGDPATATASRNATGPTILSLAATATTVAEQHSTISGSVDDPKAAIKLTATDTSSAVITGTAAVLGDGSFSGSLDLSSLADGPITVAAVGTNEVGNVGSAQTTTTSKDATAPMVSGLTATAVTVAKPSTSVTGTVDDKAATVALLATDKNGLTKSGNAKVLGDGSFSGSLALETFADGSITVEATGTDSVGNAGLPATVTFAKDGTAPMVSGLKATASTSATPASTVSGAVDDTAATVALLATDVKGHTQSGTATVSSATGSFSGTLDLSTLADGDVTVKATATDAAGNTGIAAVATTRATRPGTPAAPTVEWGDGRVTVSFTAPTSGTPITRYTVTASPGGITARGTSSPITVTGLTNGVDYTFTVSATNAGGTSLPSPPSAVATPLGDSTVSLNALPRSVVAGTVLTLTGKVRRTDPSVPTDVVLLLAKYDSGVIATLAAVPVASDGSFRGTTRAVQNGSYAAAYVGDDRNDYSFSPIRRTLAAVKIVVQRLNPSAASSVLTIKGTVGPNKKGREIRLSRVLPGGKLQLLGKMRLASNSAYLFKVKLPKGSYPLQVSMAATPGNLANTVRFTVKRT